MFTILLGVACELEQEPGEILLSLGGSLIYGQDVQSGSVHLPNQCSAETRAISGTVRPYWKPTYMCLVQETEQARIYMLGETAQHLSSSFTFKT